MRKPRFVWAAAWGLSLMICLTGCGKEGAGKEISKETTSAASSEAAKDAGEGSAKDAGKDAAKEAAPAEKSDQAEKTVAITDDLGRTVEVPYQPKRTAVLIGSFASVWQLSGGTMVATANDAWTQFDLGLDKSVVNLGKTRQINLELLISSEPELIIASANTQIDKDFLPTFDKMKIPVLYFDVNDFSEYLKMLKRCTEITGRADLYEKNGLEIQKQVDAAIAEGKKRENHPSVLYLRASAASVKAKGSKGTVLGSMLADLGCVNVADGNSLLENLSLEKNIEADPEYIFIVMQGSDEAKIQDRLKKELTGNPAWAGLSAVKEGRLFFMDQRLYNLKPNNRWGEAYEGLVRILEDGKQR